MYESFITISGFDNISPSIYRGFVGG